MVELRNISASEVVRQASESYNPNESKEMDIPDRIIQVSNMGFKTFVFCIIFLLYGCTTPGYITETNVCSILSSENSPKNISYLRNLNGVSDNPYIVTSLSRELNYHYRQVEGRKLVVFIDGTGNNNKNLTNIRELYLLALENACNGHPIIPYYIKGISTEYLNSFDQAFASGIDTDIYQAYLFLVESYKADDEIYLFGFSRGAFAARSLNGLLSIAGLIDKKSLKKTKSEYNIRTQHTLAHIFKVYNKYKVKNSNQRSFDEFSRIKNIKVKAIGVFETVAVIGLKSMSDFENHSINLYAEAGYHALSIDETRNDLSPLRFLNPKNNYLEEVWFPGGHSDIGGGYDSGPNCEISNKNDAYYFEGLETTALNWMIKRFEKYDIFPKNTHFTECRLGKLHDEYFDSIPLKRIYYRQAKKTLRVLKKNDCVHNSTIERIGKKLDFPHPKREAGGIYMPVNVISDYYQVADKETGSCTENSPP